LLNVSQNKTLPSQRAGWCWNNRQALSAKGKEKIKSQLLRKNKKNEPARFAEKTPALVG